MAGIGASAGGLDALGELFKHIRPSNVSFIVVQHLAPDHESLLTQLLARSARMPVVTAVDGTALEPNRVYVIPPNAELAVMHDVIRLLPPTDARGPRLPIDYLFRSLAEDQGPLAIGIVLSGTGTDGTLGLEAIKAAGGFTFAQEPSTAKYDGMPRSAQASGAADYCLSLPDIAAEVARLSHLARGGRVQHADQHVHAASRAQEQVGKLFVMIRSEFGNDLTQYKPATIDRRIERRMVLHKLERIEDYVKYVQQNHGELAALYQDLLITVTSFFRDPEAFETLKGGVLKELVEHKVSAQAIRAWVPGCATGEEAYSLAICLLEVCDEKIPGVRIQIFGTDIDDEAIQYARRGVYPTNISADVSPERLVRFFVKQDDGYAVARRVRDMLVFSKHNVLKDAPFSRMDLVSCRNLLIYLQPAAQKRVLRIFHYALNPVGHLFLGGSETVGDAPELFSAVDRKRKIYVRKHAAPHATPDFGIGVPTAPARAREQPTIRPTLSLQGLADRKVLELYGPPGVVINESLEILQFRGRTGRFLEPAPGAASFNILKVARFELHIELKKAVQQAIDTRLRVTSDVTFQEDAQRTLVSIDVIPLQDPESSARCFLVLFHATTPSRSPAVAESPAQAKGQEPDRLAHRVQELDHELTTTREYLQ
ncbi:MAG: chemotaxis protein CheB, partial [bacterium]